MKKHYQRVLTFLLSLLLMVFSSLVVNANVTVTPATGGNCLQLAPGGSYTVLSNITVTEVIATDFSIQTGTTFILTAPAGFEFRPGIGNVVFLSGRDITSASLLVSATTITVTLTVSNNTQMDYFRIRSIETRAMVANGTGNILRTVTGGTANIAGDIPGAGVNHASLFATGSGGAFTTVSNGVWSNPATWTGGVVPSCTDNVSIKHQVNVDVVVSLNNLTINSGGNLISDQTVTINGTFSMVGNSIYTHNNLGDAAVTIFNGTESFANTSSMIVNKWKSYTVPFMTNVNGDVGNLIFNTTGYWNQGGLFAPAKILGSLTVNAGTLVMDDGSGMTTALTVNDVIIAGTGRILFQTGAPRDLNLITGNFSDNSTNSGYTSIMFQSVGNLVMQINGDLNINHRFTGIEGVTAADVGSAILTVTGNFTVSGGTFEFLKRMTGSMNMTVNGNTHITGAPTLVSFKDYYAGDVTFNSGSTTIDNNKSTYILGTHSVDGAATINITGDLNLIGPVTRLYVASNAANLNPISVNVSNDLFLTGALCYTTSGGFVEYNIGRNFNQSGSTSIFYGQRNLTGYGDVSIDVNGSLTILDGLFVQSRSLGSVSLDVAEIITLQDADFYGMNNTTAGNNGIGTLICTDMDISGSIFEFHRGEITDGRTVSVTISNQLTINFANSTDRIVFVGRASNNNALLNLNIGANFYTTGSANGLFCSSLSAGNETVSIGGDLSVGAGRVRFNAYENLSARGHVVNGTILGSVILSGGSIAFSSNKGATDWNIAGDYDQSAGFTVFKWLNGITNINIQGNFNLVNSNAILYSKGNVVMADPVTVTINGNANFDNSVVMFDSCLTSTAPHHLIFKGNSVTFNDNVQFNHKAQLTTRIIYGSIIYDKVGTINVNRNSAAFDIRHVKQLITAGTTVNYASSPYDMMIASHSSAVSATHTTLNINGTLDMGEKMIVGRSEPNYFASVNLNNGARLKTAHVNGLYSGSAAGSCIYPMIYLNYSMNFYLAPTSTVEYNGSDNQIISGTGIGIATTPNHRYGNLDINFQGVADVEFAYPGNDSVQVRTALILTNGELNLDNDHTSNTGGRALLVLNGASISRIDGYVRSETEDGSGAIKWNITTTGSFVVPFGYNSSEYIPFTYQPISGSSGDVVLATYHSAVDNTPYPPTVTHVRDMIGADNSNYTVDRFWRIETSGNPTANLTFSVTASELAGIVNPRAQLWEPVSLGWFPPTGPQSNPTVTTTLANTINSFNTWWTLSSALTPLPVELVSFEAAAAKNAVRLDWITSAEINNDHFTVERSSNGENYTALTNIEGAGTSSTMHTYNYYDKAPFNGLNYYRLKQTDYNGKESWSDVRTVSFSKNSGFAVYPNPLIGSVINLTMDDENEKVSSVVIYDFAGKLILKMDESSQNVNADFNKFDLENKLSSGTYLVEINTDHGVYHDKIIKQ